MTVTSGTPVVQGGATSPSLRRRLNAYFRMGRTIRWENWLGTLIWWTLVDGDRAFEPRTFALLAVTLLAYVAMVATAGTMDDVTGYRDGTDWINYKNSDPTGLRPMTRKPLLLGWCTEGQAVAYARFAAVVCLTAVVVSFVMAGGEPVWYLPLYLLVMVIGFQYSAGLKLSYLGAQELVLYLVKFSSVFFPFALVTGDTASVVTVEALLFATWFVQVSIMSNSHDVEGDRQANRRTMAVLLSEEGHHRFIVAVFCTGWLIALAGLVTGALSPWFCLTLVPVVALQARQLRLSVGEHRYLEARRIGFRVLRTGVPILALINLGLNWR
ncbi:MAG TPA: UbiA family prenyltransferase [Acidimicrobiales bacterium]